MITITVYENHAKQCTGFQCIGHAGYADPGEDIVCAGVSALVINTLNALEAFTDEKFQAKTEQRSGLIEVHFLNPIGHDAELLLKTMILGLKDIQNNYGKEYSFLNFKEV